MTWNVGLTAFAVVVSVGVGAGYGIASRRGRWDDLSGLIANGHTHAKVKAARTAPPLKSPQVPRDYREEAEIRARVVAELRVRQAGGGVNTPAKTVTGSAGGTESPTHGVTRTPGAPFSL